MAEMSKRPTRRKKSRRASKGAAPKLGISPPETPAAIANPLAATSIAIKKAAVFGKCRSLQMLCLIEVGEASAGAGAIRCGRRLPESSR